jgi:hypothetical protein
LNFHNHAAFVVVAVHLGIYWRRFDLLARSSEKKISSVVEIGRDHQGHHEARLHGQTAELTLTPTLSLFSSWSNLVVMGLLVRIAGLTEAYDGH